MIEAEKQSTFQALTAVGFSDIAVLALLVVLGIGAIAGIGNLLMQLLWIGSDHLEADSTGVESDATSRLSSDVSARPSALLAASTRHDDSTDPVATLAILLALGVVGLGALIEVAGFAPVLTRAGIITLGVVGSLGLAVRPRFLIGLLRDVARSAMAGIRQWWFGTIPAVGLLALALLAGFRVPQEADEVAYHWAAPQVWAGAHRWVTSPFHFTNGFNFAETLYTPAAVFHSPTAAHWFHTMMFVLLALCAAAIARHFGGSGALTAAAVIAVPAAAMQSWLAYNDIAAAALATAACLAALHLTSVRRSEALSIPVDEKVSCGSGFTS